MLLLLSIAIIVHIVFFYFLLFSLCSSWLCVTGTWAGATGWAGFWDAFPTRVWGQQLQSPGSLAPNLHVRLNRDYRMLFNFSNSSANDLVRVLLKNLIKREKTPRELTRVSNGGWFCKFKINRSKIEYFKGIVQPKLWKVKVLAKLFFKINATMSVYKA